jgi:superfamily II DNA or RNA helicase
MEYTSFLARKRVEDRPSGFEPGALNRRLFAFQQDIVRWALRRGRACVFADCGLGKTPVQLEWASRVAMETDGNVLIVAPLAVAGQTIREAGKFETLTPGYSEDGTPAKQLTITNYERLERFNPDDYSGVVLDESSILKSYTGKTRNDIIERFGQISYRLACTATPAPNDFMELGNHAEFVGAMSRVEMLSMFFVHDGGETQKWRLKGHAEDTFWEWVASWAVMLRRPSDLGYDDGAFILPPLKVEQVTLHSEEATDGFLFPLEAQTLQERQSARRSTVSERSERAAALVNGTDEQWLLWCNLNDESSALATLIEDAVEVRGSDSAEWKRDAAQDFANGTVRVLITKPSMFGFGLNFQQCHNVVFVGLSDSYEQYYQAVRRCWRFGQKKPVQVYIVASDLEGAVVANIQRKEQDAAAMAEEMVKHMHTINEDNLRGSERRRDDYKEDYAAGDNWEMHQGDCVDVLRNMDDGSIDYQVFSPPFASLYTYSASERDMGNCKDDGEFLAHYRYLIAEQFRVTRPGRLLSFHCMNLPANKTRDGYIGIRDFRGELIRAYEEAGWIYHSEVVIWKDPVTAMQRTKALGLLHKQLVKDSAMSRQGIPDYLVTMRKPGNNDRPINGGLDHFVGEHPEGIGRKDPSIDAWQRYASPVWMDINPSNTLQHRSAREDKDERHICPLQLDVIHRALQLWSRPGDVVLSPFAGIGSEGYEAIKLGRVFIGVELKASYYKQAVLNLKAAEEEAQGELFSGVLQEV